jgi:hypothetical protein
VIAHAKFSTNSPLKTALFQIIIRPPDLPSEGKHMNLSNFFGQNFLIYEWSNDALLVSCRQIIEQLLWLIFSAKSSQLSCELTPLMFQSMIFIVLFIKNLGVYVMRGNASCWHYKKAILSTVNNAKQPWDTDNVGTTQIHRHMDIEQSKYIIIVPGNKMNEISSKRFCLNKEWWKANRYS